MSNIKRSFLISDENYSYLRPLFEKRGFSELRLRKLSADELAVCHDAYIDLISGLSVKFHGRDWWCNPVSEKNEHGSALYSKLVNYYALYKTLENVPAGTVHVACSKAEFAQLKSSDFAAKFEIGSLKLNSLKDFLKESFSWAIFLPKIVWLCVKGMLRSLTARTILKKSFNSWKQGKKPGYIIRTWLNKRCLEKKDRYYDPYFGKLPEYLQFQGFKVIILAGIYDSYRALVDHFKEEKKITVIPEEFFLGLTDYFRVAFVAIFKKIRLCEDVLFSSVKVDRIIRNELKKAYLSAAVFSNALRFFIGKNLSRELGDFSYIHPFENYAWEKAMIMGLRSGKKQGSTVRIFGFQHAFICRDSFKYFPGSKEEQLMPLPERIITLGDVTRRILSENGRYAAVDLRSGCALRQEYINVFQTLTRGKLKTIMVPLTMVRKECLKIIDFLAKSKLSDKGYSVILRFHPLFVYNSLKKDLPQGLPEGFTVNIEKSAVEAIGKADIVAYTWSTVAVEALKLGLPVVHLNILKPLRVDPLFQCPGLKFQVENPEGLADTIEKIYGLRDEQFLKERSLSLEYLKGYFLPVDEAHLRNFLP